MRQLAVSLCLAITACGLGPLRDESVLKRVNPGMTPAEVEAAVGAASYRKAAYADGTSSWTYKYKDANIAKLLHITFGPEGRVLRTETQWDPDVYSKKP